MYYGSDLKSLKAFAADPVHLEAKRQYDRWYRGYQIVIADVIRCYGDGAIPHVTTDWVTGYGGREVPSLDVAHPSRPRL